MTFIQAEMPAHGGDKKVGPIGKCIYCGAVEFEPGSEARLSDEHVMPRGMGGKLILLQASCRSCQKTIHRFETYLMGRLWLSQRHHLKLRSANRNRPDKLSRVIDSATGAEVEVDLKEFMVATAFPVIGTTHFMRDNLPPKTRGEFRHGFLGVFSEEDRDKARAQEPRSGEVTMTFDMPYFCRFVAKVAHGLMVDRFGVDGFENVLPNFILGREDDKVFYYVASIDQPRIKAPNAYSLFEIWTDLGASPQGEPIYIGGVRILGTLHFPTYVVFAGRPLTNSARPNASLGRP